ncbi:hypothetical protein HAX54_046561 [Datura stramonium]|uniref:Tyrosine specific protein phosphatases domain-containing protein n=1 Tax=Datura stramonium TaxID=4076 RepID=A0ABS8SRZ4_DATST|nr:hypothetical protein [Datura stramonium]
MVKWPIVCYVPLIQIPCLGQDSVPDAESVDRFISEVVQFTSQESQASKYAVVHCTHGLNRTGYMIVHFLVRNQSVIVRPTSLTLLSSAIYMKLKIKIINN